MWTSSHQSRSGSRAPRAQAGFTLIELLVVISIMLILTSVFVLRQQRFQSSTLLRSLAYSIALSVRQAQVYGTSVRESSAGAFSSNTAAKSYGIYFSSGSTNSYILFADSSTGATPDDGQYEPGEEVQTFKLSPGYSISQFCATPTTGSPVCWSPSSSAITNLAIIFKRPDPDSCFSTSASPAACALGSSPVYSSAYVQVQNSADTRSVNITLTGQITVGGQGS